MNTTDTTAEYTAVFPGGSHTVTHADAAAMRADGIDMSYSAPVDMYISRDQGMREFHYYRSN